MKSTTRKALVGWAFGLSVLLFAFFAFFALFAIAEDAPLWLAACVLFPGACLLAAGIQCVAQERRFRRTIAAQPKSCRRCGYALRGLRDSRCPECGHPFDPDDSTTFDFDAPNDRRAADVRLLLIVCIVAIVFICIGMYLPTLAR